MSGQKKALTPARATAAPVRPNVHAAALRGPADTELAQLQAALNGAAKAEALAGLQRRANAQAPEMPRPDAPIQRLPSNDTPNANGLHWDTTDLTNHNGANVPERMVVKVRNPGNGGVPSVNPPGWNWLKGHFGRLKGQWVRFHIINAKLGGPGNNTANLVPTTHALNHNANWRQLEDNAKASASTNPKTWTFVEVDLTYDDDYPAGIPKKIEADWGYWDAMGGGGWESADANVTLQQNNPEDEASGDFLPGSSVTLTMLGDWGLPVRQNRDNSPRHKASVLINGTYASQQAFDRAWTDADLDDYLDVWNRMYVDEDDQIAGPYGVLVKTA